MSNTSNTPIFDDTFELKDAQGVPHTYGVQFHPGGEGFALSADLTKLGLPLLGGDGFDMSAIVGSLSAVDIPKLADRVLRHTFRDGLPLSQPPVFDAACRANYAEVYQAIVKVVELNRFFPLPDTFWKEAKEGEKE